MNRQDFMLTAAAPEKRSGFTVRVMDTLTATHIPSRKTIFLGLTKPALTIILVFLLIAIPAGTYAAIFLLRISSDGVNNGGRKQFTLVDSKCTKNSPELKHFELRKDTPITNPDEIEKIIQAACEIRITERYLSKRYPVSNEPPKSEPQSQVISYGSGLIGTLSKVSAEKIYITNAAYSNSLEAPRSRDSLIEPDLYFLHISDLNKTTKAQKGATVLLVNRDDTHFSEDGHTGKLNRQTIAGIIELSLPPKYYQQMQKYIISLPDCWGNSKELCPNSGFVDIYPREEYSTTLDPEFAGPNAKGVPKQISGTVLSLTDNSLQLQSRTLHEIYTITLAAPRFKEWNEIYSLPYAPADVKLSIGDDVSVNYVQPEDQSSRSISANQVMTINLLLGQQINKTDTPIKYNTGI